MSAFPGPLCLHLHCLEALISGNRADLGNHLTGSRIASAFFVSKNHANALDAFSAKEQGHLGFFLNQRPIFYYQAAQPQGRPTFDLAAANTTTALPMVDILYAHIDANPALIEASVRSGARGLVFAGTGAGNLPQASLERARALHEEMGIPMVFSSRAMSGFVGPSTAEPWQIPGADLNPQKARIMLQLAIATGHSLAEIHGLFSNLQQV